MYSKPSIEQRRFYQHLIFNSFLIGLFPFFIPVYLWQIGFSLTGIALYISMTGISFCFSIWIWDRAKLILGWRQMVVATFVIELILLLIVLQQDNDTFIFLFALITGIYNCTFWMTQRTFFISSIKHGESGNAYGNLQIVVVLVLKLGMLTGGYLLEQRGFLSILALSTLIAGLACASTFLLNLDFSASLDDRNYQPIPLKTGLRFNDSYNARGVFIVDGALLYLESHFWLLSLFFLSNENFTTLSLIVIVLGISFSALFYLVKRLIDRTTSTLIYTISLAGYAFSWLLRALLPQMSQKVMIIALIAIAFLTALFRLNFNKRFFDHALGDKQHQYLVAKSYLSQLGLAVCYFMVGIVFFVSQKNEINHLSMLYLAALPLMFFYWKYLPRRSG